MGGTNAVQSTWSVFIPSLQILAALMLTVAFSPAVAYVKVWTFDHPQIRQDIKEAFSEIRSPERPSRRHRITLNHSLELDEFSKIFLYERESENDNVHCYFSGDILLTFETGNGEYHLRTDGQLLIFNYFMESWSEDLKQFFLIVAEEDNIKSFTYGGSMLFDSEDRDPEDEEGFNVTYSFVLKPIVPLSKLRPWKRKGGVKISFNMEDVKPWKQQRGSINWTGPLAPRFGSDLPIRSHPVSIAAAVRSVGPGDAGEDASGEEQADDITADVINRRRHKRRNTGETETKLRTSFRNDRPRSKSDAAQKGQKRSISQRRRAPTNPSVRRGSESVRRRTKPTSKTRESESPGDEKHKVSSVDTKTNPTDGKSDKNSPKIVFTKRKPSQRRPTPKKQTAIDSPAPSTLSAPKSPSQISQKSPSSGTTWNFRKTLSSSSSVGNSPKIAAQDIRRDSSDSRSQRSTHSSHHALRRHLRSRRDSSASYSEKSAA